MFGNFLNGATLRGTDPETERDPPERPLPIVFPQVTTTQTVRWSDDYPPPDFQRLFASLQGPEAVLTGHLRALNYDHHLRHDGEMLVPSREDGTSYNPPRDCTDKAFADRVAELDITNDAAFRALSKTTKPGDKAPRLLNLRKFWLSLNNMAQYWDSTADEYYTVNSITDSTEPGVSIPAGPALRYKGRRTANGREMPDTYRTETVNAFVEGVTAAFNCRVSPAYIAPKRFAPAMQVGNLEQPVRMSGIVMRLPAERDKARTGIMEGPVMGILERNTVDFDSSQNLEVSRRNSEHDLLRELGALLMIAQQRSREGQKASSQKERKWYTEKPRWGGGPGSKIPQLKQAEIAYTKLVARIAETPSDSAALEAKKRFAKKRLDKARVVAKKWSVMESQPELWNPRADYMAIGKPPGSPYDEVFLVSCLYHHISILKLTIHEAYIHYLTTGKMPSQVPSEEDWCIPRLERTTWYDLFDRSQRVDAFRCIWGVMEYANRDLATQKSDAAAAGGAEKEQS